LKRNFGNNPRITSFQASSSGSSNYAIKNMVKQRWVFRECAWDDLTIWDNFNVETNLDKFLYTGNVNTSKLYEYGNYYKLYNPGYFRYMEWSYNYIQNSPYYNFLIEVGPPAKYQLDDVNVTQSPTDLTIDPYHATIAGEPLSKYSTNIGNNRYRLDFFQFGISPRFIGLFGDYYHSDGTYGDGALKGMVLNNYVFKT
jgi:hypothetical protein